MNIYLTGLSGSGKSTVAPLLAQRRNLAHVDSDREIERRAGLAIFEIFERLGEDAFRAYESETIDAIAGGEPRVVALGGGAVLSERNRERLRASGTVVYLEISPHVCAQRLTGTTTERRPLVAPEGERRLEERLQQLFTQRKPLYEAADITVDADASPESVASAIDAALKERGR